MADGFAVCPRFQQVFLIEKLSAHPTTLNDGLYIAKDGQCIAAVVLRLMAFVLVVGDTVAFLCQSQFQPTARGQ